MLKKVISYALSMLFPFNTVQVKAPKYPSVQVICNYRLAKLNRLFAQKR